MKNLILIFCLITCLFSQNKKQSESELVGGRCQGCEAIFEYGDSKLSSTVTLPGYESAKTKLFISGTIFMPDGKTPAKNVIMYLYQTNEAGIYESTSSSKGWEKRHGIIRGWLKTGEDGRYSFYTMRPGSYPGTRFAAHIHPTLLEPNGKYYYIKDYNFSDDQNLTDKDKNPSKARGGLGLLNLKKNGDVWTATRDIILGKNIPSYN